MRDLKEVAEYVGDVSRELAELAASAGLTTLAHICKMAELEAHNTVVTMRPKVKRQRNPAAA